MESIFNVKQLERLIIDLSTKECIEVLKLWVGLDAMGEKGGAAETGVNRDGFALGLGATSSTDKSLLIDGGDAETARLFGARIAAAARRWRSATDRM